MSQWDDFIDKEFFDAAGLQLKIIATFATGVDRIDLAEAQKRKVIITNTPTPSLHWATVEAAVSLLLSVAKRTTKLYSQAITGKLPEYSPIGEMGLSLRNKTTGIVGLGRIGSKVAEMMHFGFKNKILYYSRSNKKGVDKKLAALKVSLNQLFKKSDFIFVTIPGKKETAGLIGKGQLHLMSLKSILVNISPEAVIDEFELMRLIKKRKIYGVGSDVYSKKITPLPTHDIVLTAHMANMEENATLEMTKLCVENIVKVLQGKSALTPVS